MLASAGTVKHRITAIRNRFDRHGEISCDVSALGARELSFGGNRDAVVHAPLDREEFLGLAAGEFVEIEIAVSDFVGRLEEIEQSTGRVGPRTSEGQWALVKDGKRHTAWPAFLRSGLC